ncbi:MAG: TIGR02996 domain-containing protein, partial [Gemmataceae bacterium]
MDDGDRLWHAILRRPHSRPLRQVYADWLEERGDPRSEFMRLQGRTVPADPHREAQLLRAHEAQWLGPMAGHLRDWGFAGGLIEWVCVETPVFLAHADEWVRRPGLLGVHLRRMSGHVRAVAECPALARLPYLFLGDNGLTADDVRTLLASRYLKNVRALFLQSNAIDNAGFGAIADAPALSRLRELSLSNNGLRPGLTLPAGGPLRRLRTLHLAVNHLGGDLGAVLDDAVFPALREAHAMMNGTGISELGDAPAFARMRSFSANLREGAEDDLARFAGSPHVRGLRRLAIDFYQADADRCVEALAAS